MAVVTDSEVDKVDRPQVSGKVFRFLSAMHPALSKAERKRYAGYDPDKWYDWTPEISGEFTDLMRRSPRDTSFARGFAYVAQRAVPEGQYVPTQALLEHLGGLPAAFRSPHGSGFRATTDRPGHAVASYAGMPGFANVCIAIQGELTQRLQASGAQSVLVRHAETCRVSGAEECRFEIEWTGEVAPAGARPIDPKRLVDTDIELAELGGVAEAPNTVAAESAAQAAERAAHEPSRNVASAAARVVADAAATRAAASDLAERVSAAEQPAVATPAAREATPLESDEELARRGAGLGIDLDAPSDDLFTQLRKRLAEADRQSRLYSDAQTQIDSLRLELGRVRAQAEAEVAKARVERDDALTAFADLKRKIRGVVADD